MDFAAETRRVSERILALRKSIRGNRQFVV
jgi:hypothetical protein